MIMVHLRRILQVLHQVLQEVHVLNAEEEGMRVLRISMRRRRRPVGLSHIIMLPATRALIVITVQTITIILVLNAMDSAINDLWSVIVQL